MYIKGEIRSYSDDSEPTEPNNKKNHPVKTYECSKCMFTTKWRSAYFRHKKYCEGNCQYECEDCGAKFHDRYSREKHHESKHGLGLLCSHCSRTFNSRQGLEYHMEVVRGDFKFQRDECGKTFLSKQHYEGHVNRHRKTSPYECEVCGKRFTYKANLHQHSHSSGCVSTK